MYRGMSTAPVARVSVGLQLSTIDHGAARLHIHHDLSGHKFDMLSVNALKPPRAS
jgi:hypothetical protein